MPKRDEPCWGDHVMADGERWVVVGRNRLPSRDGGTVEFLEVKRVFEDGETGSSVHLYRPESTEKVQR